MTYWERRWAADAARAHREADALAADIARLHMRAAARIQAMAGRIRQRFRAAYALSEEDAAALLAAPAGREMYLELLAEIERLGPKNPMRDALLAKAAAPGYAYRIGVAEAMLQELDAVTAHLAQQEETLIRAHLTQTLQDKANRAGYLIQLEAGVGFRFHPISGELAREMLRRPWSGMEFSGRIWRNREALAGLLNTVLLEGLTAGNSAQAMAQEITESMNVSIQRAKTLVRTETTYVCNQADLHAYAEAEITAYRYCATLDMRTSRACRALDGKEFETAEAVVGSNYPPMHPNCRSVTRPAIGQEELARMERWARDPVTGKGVKVPADMTYAQWRGMQAETYGETLEERAKGVTPDRKGAEGDKKKRLKVAKTVDKDDIIKAEIHAVTYRSFSSLEEVNGFFYYDDEHGKRGRLVQKTTRHGKWKSSLTKEEEDCIFDYAGAGYHELNRYLRKAGDWQSIDAEKKERMASHLDAAISRYPLRENIRVQRGVMEDALDDLVAQYGDDWSRFVGKTYRDSGYMSTTALHGNAVATAKPVVFEIDVPAGIGRGAYINQYAGQYQDVEFEFLLPRGSQFIITGIEKNEEPIPPQTIIKMRMIVNE